MGPELTPKIPPPSFAFLRTELVEVTEGRVVCRFAPTPEMENPYGVIQGGLLAAMIDNMIGLAVASVAQGRPFTTISLSLSFLSPARPGEILRGVAEVVKAGRSQVYVEARLEREANGTLLVRATATNLLLGEEAPPPA